MRPTKMIIAAAVAGCLVFGTWARGEATAPAQNEDSAALLARIDALQGRVQQLQKQQVQTQADITGAIHDILADADKHSQLMSMTPSGFSSGYDPNVGFVVQSSDGNFSMHPGALFQFRNMASYRPSIPAGGGGITGKTGSDIQDGFVVSRLRFTLDGNMFSPNLTYFFQVADDNGNSGLTLLDAYFQYRISSQSPLALKFGQFKDPVWHEANLLPGNQLAVDRSLANALLAGGQDTRVQGVGLVYDKNNFRGQFAIHDGYNSQNTKFFDAGGIGAGVGAASGVTPTNWGASVRAEEMVIGDRQPEFNPFSQYDQFSAMGAKQDILVVGGGADYSEAGADHIIFHTLDAQYDSTCGVSLYGAYLGAYRSIATNNGAPLGHYYDSGFIVQAGYMLTSKLEPFVRYDYTHLDGKALPGIVHDNVHEITVGANYYLSGQHAKISIDGSWLPNGSPTDMDMLGVLRNDGHNEFTLRAQFQLGL